MNTTQPQGIPEPAGGQVCQSCAMPMAKPEDFGTNVDGSQSQEYCRYCYQQGNFTMNMNLQQFIEKQIEIAVEKLGMSETDARKMAESTLPNLKRWKS